MQFDVWLTYLLAVTEPRSSNLRAQSFCQYNTTHQRFDALAYYEYVWLSNCTMKILLLSYLLVPLAAEISRASEVIGKQRDNERT